MSGTDPARSGSGRRLALVVVGIVVLLALGGWAFLAINGGDDATSTPGGPTGPNTSPSQPGQTSASTSGPAQSGNAAIQLTGSLGADSRRVLVNGSGFGANEEVAVSVDGAAAKRFQTDASGAFTASLTVSFAKATFVVRAVGATSGRSATATVTF